MNKKTIAITATVFVVIWALAVFGHYFDESPLEATGNWVLGTLASVGFLLQMPINLPIIWIIHWINGSSGMGTFDYNFYFWYVLPLVTATVYSGLVALVLVKKRHKTAKNLLVEPVI